MLTTMMNYYYYDDDDDHGGDGAGGDDDGYVCYDDYADGDDACERVGDGDVADHLIEVGRHNILPDDVPASATKLSRQYAFANLGDTTVRNGFLIEDDLEAVVAARVVAARDHDAGLALEVLRREIEQRRRHFAEVDDIAATVQQRLDQCRLYAGARQASVTRDQQ